MVHQATFVRPTLRVAIDLLLLVALCLALFALTTSAQAQPAQQRFDSAQSAADALVLAARSSDTSKLRRILGAGARHVLSSGDAQQDERTRAEFVAAAEAGMRVDVQNDDRAVLLLGATEWPLPFPLVREGDQRWRFDTRAGLQEFLDRQIGANELAAIEVVRAYVDAQREYVLRDHTRNGLLEYAQHLVSSVGQRDGLYWPTEDGEAPSPLGAALGAADTHSLRGVSQQALAYHGYRFRILRSQGPSAPGGAFSYVVNGRMIGGFAMVAYPARWKVSGVMSFIVNHDGVVFSRNLGAKTASIASKMAHFDPSAGWKVESAGAQVLSTSGLPLLGTSWQLAAPERLAKSPQLQFLEGGRLAGSDGCNRLIGSYVLIGDTVTFGKLASSRMACAAMQGRDTAFTAALARVTHWRVKGRKLVMSAEDAVVLEFTALAP